MCIVKESNNIDAFSIGHTRFKGGMYFNVVLEVGEHEK
jgi:hypothetical protein